MARVLVAGLATIDFLFDVDEMPERAEKYRAHNAVMVGGGGAANAAASVVRLGGEAYLAAPIGDDRIGDMILADLAGEGVDTSLIQRSADGRSAFSSVLVDAAGERQIVNFRGAGVQANLDLDVAPRLEAVLADTRFPELTQTALRLAKRSGIPGIVDGEHPVNLGHLSDATHIAFSAQGLIGLTGGESLPTALKAVAAQVSAWLCVTDGASGVFFLRKGKVEHIPAFQIDPVDTLAAGDVWHGAFALQLAEGANEDTAMEFANAAATLKCLGAGGRAGCPDRETTNRFIKGHKQSDLKAEHPSQNSH